MLKIATLSAVMLSACTPGMHHAYQNTTGGAALAGWGVGEVITYRELTRPGTEYRESRPTFGMGPAPMVATFAFVNLAIVAGIRFMPDTLFDQYTPWIKDVLMTTAAVTGVADGYCDYSLTRR